MKRVQAAKQPAKPAAELAAELAAEPAKSKRKRTRRTTEEIIDRIIAAATAEFGLHGFLGAKTAVIAKRAEVAEALIMGFEMMARLSFAALLSPIIFKKLAVSERFGER